MVVQWKQIWAVLWDQKLDIGRHSSQDWAAVGGSEEGSNGEVDNEGVQLHDCLNLICQR